MDPLSPSNRISMLEAALEAAGDALFLVDAQGKVLIANAAASRLGRFTPGDTIPAEWMAIESPIFRVLSGEREASGDVADTSGLLRLSARVADAPGAVVVAARAPAQADDLLLDERGWAWTVVETVASLVVVLDQDGRIVRFNQACQAATGYRAEEIRGRKLWDVLVAPEGSDDVRNAFAGLRHGRFPNRFEHDWVARDGSRRRILWANTAVSGVRGELEYVIGTGIDITDRKRVEDDLRRANHMLRTVIDTSPLAIVTMDLDGRVASWNPAAERIFGWSASEVLGQVLPLMPENDQEFFHAAMERVTKGDVLEGLERKRQRKDGSLVDCALWNGPRRNADGEVTGVVAIIADITERKRLEEQFRQSQKMEAVGRLAGGIAHDFNNLLTVITGYSQMLAESMTAADPMRANVDEVLHAAESAAALTGQLLAFSRRQLVLPQVLDLSTLLGNMDKMLRPLIGEDVELVMALNPNLPRVKVDPGQFQQVVLNLVVNARDAMPDGGKLTIETASTYLDDRTPTSLPPGPYVSLSVIDTGKGMDEETRRRIFEPFFTTKSRGKGTGLGLSTAYGIVQQSGGDIWVSTAPGKGAHFQIFLPVIEQAVAASAECASGKREERHVKPKGSETVLLVEDEPGLRRLISEVLKGSGYTVLEAGDYREALRLCEQQADGIELFLTDVVMPRMSGRELAECALALHPTMKVLFMSGYTDGMMAQHGVLSSGTPFLQKPFTPDILLATVRSVLAGKPE